MNRIKFTSWNVNGLRSVWQKGFANWLESEDADFVALQETKIQEDLITEEFKNRKGYQSFWHSAKRPGYSGVAVFAKKEPLSVQIGLGIDDIDSEGRVLALEYPKFTLINAYFPNSGRDLSRLPYKQYFCKEMAKFCQKIISKGKHVVLCGDYNIAHEEIDLRNPKSNQKNAGFLPEEREWMKGFLSKEFVDPFRRRNPDPGHYTWWSYRPGVRAKNVGWRIDYHCVNQELDEAVTAVGHQPQVMGSDHCPIYLELKLS